MTKQDTGPISQKINQSQFGQDQNSSKIYIKLISICRYLIPVVQIHYVVTFIKVLESRGYCPNWFRFGFASMLMG